MKKKNIIVFVFAILFIGLGFSGKYLKALRYCAIDFLVNNLPTKGIEAFDQFTDDVDTYSKDLWYKHILLDLDSAKHFCLNTKLVPKGTEVVSNGEADTLIVPYESYPQEGLIENVTAVKSLQLAAEDNGAEFLYIAAPEKNMLYEAPANIENHSLDNFARYMDLMQQSDIPVLDLYEALRQENMINADTCFKTDHHWTPETAFWATGKICSTLSDRYDFEYNADYTNIANYDTQLYTDWFLGSYGKKVGRFFTAAGPDDITLITPKFETDLTEQQPFKEEERTGSFAQTVIFMEHLQTKDYHSLSAYAAYGGGDFRLQIIKNNLNPTGKKILIVRDSFAGAVTPFLSLNAGELHIVDVRDFISTEPLDVYDYMDQIDPDYVLVLYSGTGDPVNDHNRYCFGASK